MNDLKNIFGKLTASDELKNRIYEAAEKNAPHEVKKRPALKKTAAVLLSAAAVLAVSITTAAVTGFFDLGTVMRNRFDDNISAAKLEEGSYQPLDISAENDLLSVRVSAFIGDYEDCCAILEAKLNDPPDDLKKLSLDILTYDETCADTDKIGWTTYDGVPVADENGETVYIFRAKCYPYWSESATENQVKLFFDVQAVSCESGAKNLFTRTPTKLSLGFVPDKSVIRPAKTIELDAPASSNNIECTVNQVVSTVYATKAVISYPIYKSAYDGNWALWDAGRKQGRIILAIPQDTIEFSDDRCPVRLRVDGEYVPYLRSGLDEYYNGQPYAIVEVEDSDEFACVLQFEHIDFDSAESVVLELRNGLDPTQEITIK
ncbi:MAG: hypothetical protein HDT21_11680 [Ruminococcus sp.]|nr:hypothetical protein [Ruminococcus sp.]